MPPQRRPRRRPPRRRPTKRTPWKYLPRGRRSKPLPLGVVRLIVAVLSVGLVLSLLSALGKMPFTGKSDGGDSSIVEDADDNAPPPTDNLPTVSLKGAQRCLVIPGKPIFLDDSRVATCTQAKMYAKARLVKKHQAKEGARQFNCLDELWMHESKWSAWAVNGSSAAFGIAQILPDDHGTPMSLGDWKAQVDWGLTYIYKRYHSPCNAWAFWQCTSSCKRYPKEKAPPWKTGRPGDPQRTWY